MQMMTWKFGGGASQDQRALKDALAQQHVKMPLFPTQLRSLAFQVAACSFFACCRCVTLALKLNPAQNTNMRVCSYLCWRARRLSTTL